MPVKVVNLTEQLVSQKVDDVLQYYPVYPYQKVFSRPYMRKKLIAKVLNHSRNHYIALRDSEKVPRTLRESDYLTEESVQIENLIRTNIVQLANEEAALHPELNALHYYSENEPSHWFG